MNKQTGKEFLNTLSLSEKKAIFEIMKIENTHERLKTKGSTSEVRNEIENIVSKYSKEWQNK